MSTVYDVAILGSGLGGTLLGSILARNGARVVIVDKGSHPRFAIGESTIPQMTMMLKVLAERYKVPELHNISCLSGIDSSVTRSCGVKRIAGFVYHRQDRDPDPDETNQSAAGQEEAHYFRQDIDHYLLKVAASYGCTIREDTSVGEIDLGKDGVCVSTNRGEIRCRFLVDGSGHNSIVARMLDLRNTGESIAATHSRSIFTHMVDVAPLDDVLPWEPGKRMTGAWNQGTLHHVFDRGWFWVIPFGNHARASNDLCSVGLVLDSRHHPRDRSVPAADEFYAVVDRFPLVKAQFERARAARDWVATDRMNYTSRASVGDRFALLSHSYGFIDPLFSRGMCNTVETINVLAGALIRALDPADEAFGDFSRGRFAAVDDVQRGLITFNDRLVNCALISFKDYDLWNAYCRIWMLMGIYGYFRVARAYYRYRETGDPSFLASLETTGHPGCITSNDELWGIFTSACGLVEATEPDYDNRYRLTCAQAAAGIFALLRSSNAFPSYLQDLGDPRDRFTRGGKFAYLKFRNWLRNDAPESLRSEYFDFDPATSLM